MLENYIIDLFVTFDKKINTATISQRGTLSVLLVTILCRDIEGETHFAEMLIATVCDAVCVLQCFTVQK